MNLSFRIEAIGHQIPEDVMSGALTLAKTGIQDAINHQVTLLEQYKAKIGSTATVVETQPAPALSPSDLIPVEAPAEDDDSLVDIPATDASTTDITGPPHVQNLTLAEYAEMVGYQLAMDFFARGIADRKQRSQAEGQMRDEIIQELRDHLTATAPGDPIKSIDIQKATDYVVNKAFRASCSLGKRPDGRAIDEVRQVTCTPGMIPEPVHGSAFFTRGDTHVLCSVTLGSKNDGKLSNYSTTQNFFLHYDFPPYCTGTTGSSAVNRRMVGHGNLAERAVRSLIPSFQSFPYTVRVFSESTSSSGSSSMASVCGASLALMDAGVPIEAAAAGLSIGLVTVPKERGVEGGGKYQLEYTLLTDIIGSEDHFGDMVSSTVLLFSNVSNAH